MKATRVLLHSERRGVRALFAVVLCTHAAHGQDHAIVGRDSLGWRVTVEETAVRRLLLASTAPIAPASIRLAAPSGDPGFSAAVWPRFAANGRIVVVAPSSNHIIVFGRDGKAARGVGNSGDGPGEFRGIAFAALTSGDSIVAVDPRLRRITIFNSRDSVVLASTIDRSGIPEAYNALGYLTNGAIIGFVRLTLVDPPAELLVREPWQIVRWWPGDQRVDRLLVFDGGERIAVAVDNKRTVMTPALARTTLPVATQDGFALLDNAGNTLRVFDANGLSRGTMSIRYPLPPVTEEMRNAERRSRNPGAAIRFPPATAVIQQAPIWDGKRWWFGFAETPGNATRWIGVSLDGMLSAGPRTTLGQYLYDVRDGFALVVSTDADGFRVVGLHPMPDTR